MSGGEGESHTIPYTLTQMSSGGGDGEVVASGSDEGATVFEVASKGDVRAEICRALVAQDHDILQLARSQRELENIFLQLVQGGRSHARR